MRTRLRHSPAALLGCLSAVALLTACSNDTPTGTTPVAVFEDRISICHRSGTSGQILDVPAADLSMHRSNGDYITHFVVNHDADAPDDGIHFHKIGDAIAAARAGRLARGELRSAACRITIDVAPGVYPGAAADTPDPAIDQFPLIVDVPDITLHGALVMRLDGRGIATGRGIGPQASVLAPSVPLPFIDDWSVPLIFANGHPGGSAGNGLTVEGFVLRSGHDEVDGEIGGQAVTALRVRGLTIRGNKVEAGFTESFDLRATSAFIGQNHLGGTGGTCDMCLAGPGTYRVTGNRLLAGGIPGITVEPVVGLPAPAGAEPFDLPASAEVSAEIWNNEVRDHLRIPVGVGIRVDAIGLGASNVHGVARALIQDNLLVNNRFAMIFHAAFPVAGTDLKGDIDVRLGGNVMRQSCQANLLVSLSRHTTALGLTDFPYLLNSTFRIDLGGDLRWENAWFSDPVGYGNQLIVNGQPIPNGARQFYDPDTCPGTARQ